MEVVQAECFLQESKDHRPEENAAISTFGKSPNDHAVASDGPLCCLGPPCDGLWHPSLCSFDCWGHGGASWPSFNIHANRTASKLGQRVEFEAECCAKFQGEVPYFQTLIEWFNREIPESMACLDAEVEEDVLERGMLHAPPEP